jgi:hypothetical protein
MKGSAGGRWIAAIGTAVVLAVLGCDAGDEGKDDGPAWRGAPEIVASGGDAADGLVADATAAIAAAPKWLTGDLTEAFLNLDDERQAIYAGVILDAPDERYVDELAFLVAHVSPTDLTSRSFDPALLTANVAAVYEADAVLPYVTLVDEPAAPEGSGNCTTAAYETPEGPLRIDCASYYWFVVHPRLEDERPAFINPGSGAIADPPTGVFWRDYLLNHADAECPGKAACPLLSEMLAAESYLWTGLHDAQDNGAIGAITRWVNVSMAFEVQGERPIQPVRIYALHRGYCGEHADITSAAGRAALIPTTNAAAYADDHTWNEFLAESWREWEPVNDYIDEFGNYDQWTGGGLGLHAVHDTRGDGYVWNRTPDYSATCTLDVTVTDAGGLPVDGARVVAGTYYGGRFVPSFAGWTDFDGKVVAEVGDQDQTFYLQASSPLGTAPAEPERVVVKSEAGKTYAWTVALPETRTALPLAGTSPVPGAGRYIVTASWEFPRSYLHATSIVAGLDFIDNTSPGRIRAMLLDEANAGLYDDGEPFEALAAATESTGDLDLDVPAPGTYYLVVSNEEAVSSAQLGTVTVTIRDARTPDGPALADDTRTLRLLPGERYLYALRGF